LQEGKDNKLYLSR